MAEQFFIVKIVQLLIYGISVAWAFFIEESHQPGRFISC